MFSIPVSRKGKSTEDQRSVDPSDGTQSQRPRGPTFFRAAWETQSAGSRGPGSASAGIIVGILQAAEFLDGCPFCCHGRPDEPLQSSSILPPVSSASVCPPHSPPLPALPVLIQDPASAWHWVYLTCWPIHSFVRSIVHSFVHPSLGCLLPLCPEMNPNPARLGPPVESWQVD